MAGRCRRDLVLINGAYGKRLAKICDVLGRRFSTFETAEDEPTTFLGFAVKLKGTGFIDRLLFYVIPGLIAFGVDFATGAIYFPPGKTAQIAPEKLREAIGADGKVDNAKLQAILESELGRSFPPPRPRPCSIPPAPLKRKTC